MVKAPVQFALALQVFKAMIFTEINQITVFLHYIVCPFFIFAVAMMSMSQHGMVDVSMSPHDRVAYPARITKAIKPATKATNVGSDAFTICPLAGVLHM